MSEISRTLVLKRAYFPDGYNGGLEQIISAITQQIPDHKDLAFQAELFKTYRLAKIETLPGDEGLHIQLIASETCSTGFIHLIKSAKVSPLFPESIRPFVLWRKVKGWD
jgi:hypothetical protein